MATQKKGTGIIRVDVYVYPFGWFVGLAKYGFKLKENGKMYFSDSHVVYTHHSNIYPDIMITESLSDCVSVFCADDSVYNINNMKQKFQVVMFHRRII